MGVAICLSACFGCGQLFSFNPISVPSIRVNGVKQPVCRSCIEQANPQRIANGLEAIIPTDDAYESCDEMELP